MNGSLAVDVVALQEDALGLPDQVTCVERPVEVVDLLSAGERHRRVPGDQQADLLGVVVERVTVTADSGQQSFWPR